MGNCQAADAATVFIVHPSGYKYKYKYKKVDMINHCSSLTARDVMNSYPGHYVAQLLLPINNNNNNGSLMPVPVVNKKQLKLLQPHHTLLIAQVYHLITYQDVLKQFAVNNCMKLRRLLMDRGLIDDEVDVTNNTPGAPLHVSSLKNVSRRRGHGGRKQHQSDGGGRQWEPALNTISELGN
ncbi:uncharacterized protein LOC143590123 [Bidens hawaiensis]|uniref:uncharacterized protein LOC143590123 n=1 Tax=Bidens hawaiensis TaxID=980011 RepID=UPI00404B6DF2